MVILVCPNCGLDLYEPRVWPPVFGSHVTAQMFPPANPDVPDPINGTLMACPFCHAMLAETNAMFGIDPLFVVRDVI